MKIMAGDRHERLRKYHPLRVGSFCLCLSFSGLLFCEPAQGIVSAEKVQKAVEDAKILAQDYKVSVTVRDDEVLVSTYRHPNAADKDCKIDAVLIAKQVMTVEPAVIRVRVRLFSLIGKGKFDEVVVRAGDIKAFAAGQIKEEDLLRSLEIEKGFEQPKIAAPQETAPVESQPAPVRATNTLSALLETAARVVSGASSSVPVEPSQPQGVVDGPLKTERAELLKRIRSLQEQGVGIKQFLDEFSKLETIARNNNLTELAEPYESLSSRIAEQEKYLTSRRRRSTPTAAATSTTSTSTRSATAHTTKPGSTRVMQTPVGAISTPTGGMDMLSFMLNEYQANPELVVTEGPMKAQRHSISVRLWMMKKKGYDISKYMGEFRKMESYAATNQAELVKYKVKNMASYLGMPDPTQGGGSSHHGGFGSHGW